MPRARSPSGTSVPDAARALALTPHGALHLVDTDDPDDRVPTSFARALDAAFARGEEHGLFHLGASAVSAPLPPALAWWRAYARRFVSALRAQPDLETLREGVVVPPPSSEELARLADTVPPMTGAEYVTAAVLEAQWTALQRAFSAEIAATSKSVQDVLHGLDPVWNLVGRVYFHLAENKRDADTPFAFLATYAARVSDRGTVQHRPLGEALREHAGARDRNALLALLLPVQRAAAQSAWLQALVDRGDVFQPLAWTPHEAYAFLREVPTLEAAGVIARVPNWWNARKPPRPQVRVTVGSKAPSSLGLDALLDFAVDVALDGEPLTAAEQRALLASTDGLVSIRGRWVEVDREKLAAVLTHWKQVQKAAGRDGLSFLEGMRLLAGAPVDDADAGARVEEVAWTGVTPGAWLAETLAELRAPDGHTTDPGDALHTTLRPYQRDGVRWLWLLHRLGLGGCLADDMGLGKTVQVIALLLLVQRARERGPNLLVVPASLLPNWQSEIARFAPGLRTLTAHASALDPAQLTALDPAELNRVDIVLTTYGTLRRVDALAHAEWNIAVLDEAQAIKNPGAQQTRAAKTLRARHRVALTGTPVENHLGDLWSLFDFVNPGLLGTAPQFKRFARALAQEGSEGYAPLRRLVAPYILRRMKTDPRVITDLPAKTEVRAHCSLTRTQAALYQESVTALARELRTAEGIQRRGLVLASLMRLKQICNHPSQWTHDGGFDPAESGKFARLRELCESIAARQERALVFTQFREMTAPLAELLTHTFGRPGAVLHGGTPVAKRKALVADFQRDDGPPFFVLSLKAGGTGLNLTAASHVIHFDRWWNPAVEDQATDRAFRIGQKRNVLVHKFVCKGTVEERIDALIEGKRGVARAVIEQGGEVALTEMDDAALLAMVALDLRSALGEA